MLRRCLFLFSPTGAARAATASADSAAAPVEEEEEEEEEEEDIQPFDLVTLSGEQNGGLNNECLRNRKSVSSVAVCGPRNPIDSCEVECRPNLCPTAEAEQVVPKTCSLVTLK